MELSSGFRFFVLFASLVASCAPSDAQTLRDELTKHGVPTESIPIQNLRERITSFAVLDNSTDFVIAYYIDDGSQLLAAPLFLKRYSKQQNSWKTTEISKAEASFRGVPFSCMGSALGIVQDAGFFFLHTHLNPSAGCLMVLSQGLELKKSLCGGYMAVLRPGLLVFQRCQIHFAPTHPMEIAVYDLKRDLETLIYPPRPDPIRAEYVTKLRALIRNEEWCREHNMACDPEQFNNEISGSLAVNQQTHALAFVAQFDPYGLVPEDVADQPPGLFDEAVYVFRFSAGRISHCEFWLDEIKERFGKTALEELLTPGNLDKLFAKMPR